jgi:hypothetical protein
MALRRCRCLDTGPAKNAFLFPEKAEPDPALPFFVGKAWVLRNLWSGSGIRQPFSNFSFQDLALGTLGQLL